MGRRGRVLIWIGYLALWTLALLLPAHLIDTLPGIEILEGRRFWVAKGLHVTAYAILAILSGWLRLPARFRLVLVFLLMGHPTVTELMQQLVPGRTGSLRDVALDQIGVTLGLLLSWNWWAQPEAADPEAAAEDLAATRQSPK